MTQIQTASRLQPSLPQAAGRISPPSCVPSRWPTACARGRVLLSIEIRHKTKTQMTMVGALDSCERTQGGANGRDGPQSVSLLELVDRR